ncbi:hypothetical protein CFBP6625_25540 (plasmid) [Agrobacterium tumefaciens]|nr:hypothetical protein CFBP6625_25540 [Agrobacterium tumefaciens]
MTIKTLEEITRDYLNEATKAAVETFSGSVVPVYGSTEHGHPDHLATAMLLELSEGKFLLTAAHVLDHNETTTLYVGVDDFVTLQFEALASAAPNGDRDKDHIDFAIARLDAVSVAKLSNAKFIAEAQISRSVASSEGRLYTCLGYPNSKNVVKPFKGPLITPYRLPYTSVGRPASALPDDARDEFHILVDYDSRYTRDEDGNKMSATNMRGCSGGAIIDHGKIELESLPTLAEPKLAGLFIEGHRDEKIILGTRVSAILAAVRQHWNAPTLVSPDDNVDN